MTLHSVYLLFFKRKFKLIQEALNFLLIKFLNGSILLLCRCCLKLFNRYTQIFEVFTESYGEKPIVIQGAGAGAAVTARGVFGDILRLAEKN